MIDSIANLLFRCSHRRLTRPVTPVSRAGVPHGAAYVVCLDCGKQFSYDTKEMRVGKPIPSPEGVLPANMPKPRTSKFKYVLWGLPVGIAVGAMFHSTRKKPEPALSGPEKTQPSDSDKSR